MRDVGIPILTVLGLGHEEGNSQQEKKDKVEFHNSMTNKRVVELAEINDISCEVGRKRWNWLGHILRREGENDGFPR